MNDYQQPNPQDEAPVYHARFMDDDPDVLHDAGGVPVSTDAPADEAAIIPPPREAIFPDPPLPAPCCPRCGGDMPEGEQFCHTCGLPRQNLPRFCTGCGAALPRGYNFCGQCGRKISLRQPPKKEKIPGLGQGIAGMVMGIIGLVFCWIPFFGLIPCLVGLILSILAKKKGCQGQAKAGIICSSIGLGIQGILLLCILLPALSASTVSVHTI